MSRLVAPRAIRGLPLVLSTILVCSAPLRGAPIESAPAVTEQENKYQEIKDAATKFNAGDVQQALEMLEVAQIRHPELPPARVMLARFFFGSNQLARGRTELERVIVELPDDPEAYEILGRFALADGRITEANMLYQKASELVGKMGESTRMKNITLQVQAGLALTAEARAQWPLARDYLSQWIKLDEKDSSPHVRLAQVLFRMEQPNEAYAEFQKAAKLSGDAPPPEIAMGRMCQQKGDLKKADEWISLAIEREPEDAAVQIGAAEWYYQSDKPKEAQQHADAALKLNPDSIEAKLVRGLIARYVKDYATAETQLESAHLLAPANFTASNQLALVLSEQSDEGKLRRAAQLAELNVRQYPNNPDAMATLGAIYLKAGKLDQAEKALARAASGGQISGDTAFYLAQLLVKRDRGDRAKQFLRSALDAKGPFVNRAAAQALYDEINKKAQEPAKKS